jgi:flagellar protein FliT
MTNSLLDHYRALERAAMSMLEAARADDWNEVVRVEALCATLIIKLKARLRVETLNPEEKQEKEQILLRILTYDAEIRDLAEEELPEFSNGLLPADHHMVH